MAVETVDCSVQIRRLHEITGAWGEIVHSHRFTDQWPFDISRRGQGSTSVVVGEEVGAELGRPGTTSHALVLTTPDGDLVQDGVVRCVGRELDQCGPEVRVPFLQVVILAFKAGAAPDPYELEATQYLTNRVQGYMARTVPGRLWVRVGRDLIDRGFRLPSLGSVLLAAFRMDFPEVTRAEVLLVTGDDPRIREVDSIAAEFKVISGRNRKLVLAEKGIYDCRELDCDTCEEQTTCDALKDVAVRYRKLPGTRKRT